MCRCVPSCVVSLAARLLCRGCRVPRWAMGEKIVVSIYPGEQLLTSWPYWAPLAILGAHGRALARPPSVPWMALLNPATRRGDPQSTSPSVDTYSLPRGQQRQPPSLGLPPSSLLAVNFAHHRPSTTNYAPADHRPSTITHMTNNNPSPQTSRSLNTIQHNVTN